MQVNITRTVPILREPLDTGVFIQWTVSEPPSAALTFRIERAGSPEGPFELIVNGITGYYFFDRLLSDTYVPLVAGDIRENPNFLSLVRSFYYRVTATASDGTTVTTTREIQSTLPPRLERLRRKMLRDLSIGFKFNGMDTYVLKRKHWGLRCKACFDALTKKVTSSKCTTCFGVGFEGGYESPVLIRGRFCAPNSNTDLAPQGLSDVTKIRFICGDYPNIDPYDILIEKQQNQRFIVQQQAQTELRRNMVHQSLITSLLTTDSIEYRIPVNTDTVPVIY